MGSNNDGQYEVFYIKLLNSPYCRPLSVMRRRTPGFVACAEITSKARDAVDIDIIKLLVILDITFQLELKLKTKRWRDLG